MSSKINIFFTVEKLKNHNKKDSLIVEEMTFNIQFVIPSAVEKSLQITKLIFNSAHYKHPSNFQQSFLLVALQYGDVQERELTPHF